MQKCGQCAKTTTPGALFCHHCGHRLSAAVESQTSLRRERKWISIIFADVRESLSIVATLDPEYAHELLSSTIELMKQAVDANGGIVNRVTGDGIMALFGAPIGAEDHATRACAAALDMIERVKKRVDQDLTGSELSVKIRVGINTGEVLVHPTTEFGTVVYDATGEAVHMASRMEQCARANEVYISRACYAEAMGTIRADDLGEITVKGLELPVQAYRLTGLSARGRVQHFASSGQLSPFFGRGQELDLLQNLKARAEAGHGAAVRILGDPGCGKSRLVEEFIGKLPRETWAVFKCQAQRYRKTGFRGIADLLEQLAGTSLADTSKPMPHDMPWLPAATSTADRVALAVISGAVDEDSVWKGVEPRERKERLDGATARLLDNLSAAQPTLFVVDDGHWLDDDSASQFAAFCNAIETRPVLVVVTSRKSPDIEAMPLPVHIEHELLPLSRADTSAMVRALVAQGRDRTVLEEKLIELTQGNPLFVEECLYSLVTSGIIRATDDSYVLVDTVTDLRVPTNLRGLIASRVDRVADRDKDVLQAASVIGQNLSRSLLEELVKEEPVGLVGIIDRLCANGFLIARPSSQLSFRHGLTREAVYESIPIRRRIEMHAAVLQSIESWEGDHVELLADHAVRAHRFEKAALYCRQSGNKAFQRDAKDEAIRFLRQGLDASAHWPSGPEQNRMQFDLHLDLRNPLFQLARIRELAEHMKLAQPLASDLEDPVRLGRYYPYVSHLSWFQGDSSAALDAVRSTIEIASVQGDSALAARAKFQEGVIWLSQSRSRNAVAALTQVMSYIGDNADEYQYGVNASLAVTTLSYIARAQIEAGQEEAAWTAARQGMSIAAELGNPFASAFAYSGLGYCYLRTGKASEALPLLQNAYDASAAGEAPLMIPVSASFLAWALVEAGQPERGVEYAALAAQKAEEIGFQVFQPVRLFIWAHALAAAGLHEDARSHAQKAIGLAGRQNELGAKAHALKILGELELQRDRQTAIETLKAGLVHAQELELLPLVRDFEAALGFAHSAES